MSFDAHPDRFRGRGILDVLLGVASARDGALAVVPGVVFHAVQFALAGGSGGERANARNAFTCHR